MPSLKTFNAFAASTREVIEHRDSSLKTDSFDATILFMFYECEQDENALYEWAISSFPEAALIGGSFADNDVSGQWSQLGPDGPLEDELVFGVLFPSSPLSCAFQGGYEPVGPNGIVTGIGYRLAGDSGVVTGSSGREILSIDNEPAAEVHNR